MPFDKESSHDDEVFHLSEASTSPQATYGKNGDRTDTGSR
jgi:hypothetical protein